MRNVRQIRTLAEVFTVAIAVVGLLSMSFTDCVFSAYLETRRWLAAAGPIKKLETATARSRDAVPCSDSIMSGRAVGPNQYFPPGLLGCGGRQDDLLTKWYSEQLKALGEPSLWALSKSDSHARVYRFLWLRSFHHPVSVRVIINSDLTGTLVLKIASGAGGYAPGDLVRNESVPVGKHGTSLLFARVLQARLWELPTRGHPGGNDGANWIVEAVADGKYQIVDRWSPGEADPVHALGMTFITDLAGLQVDPKEVY